MSSPVATSSIVGASLGKVGVMRLDAEYKHDGAMTVQSLFDSCASAALGRSDFGPQLRVLSSHLVQTVADLRLLIVENQLRELGLPIRLCVWIEEEVAKLSGTVGGVSVTIPTQATAALPPIPLSSPVAPRPQHTSSRASFSAGRSAASAVTSPSSAAVAAAVVPSPEKVAVFAYRHDFDQSGLIYYLGTRGGTTPFSNPADAGHVIVTASGLNKASSPLSAVVGRETVRCVTNSSDGSWIQVELRDFFLRPTNYSLKHYITWDTECLRDWKLEGSVDGELWTLLREHRGDTNLSAKGATCTWDILPDTPLARDQTPSIPSAVAPAALADHLLTASSATSSSRHWYRFFRVTMLGPNSNQHLYLACSGIELYGYAMARTQMQAWNATPAAARGRLDNVMPFTSAMQPPWPLPRDATGAVVLSMQQGAPPPPAQPAKALAASASSDDLNSTLVDDDDEKSTPSSIALLSTQLSNLAFASAIPLRDAQLAAANAAAAAAPPTIDGLAALGSAGLFTYASDFDRNGIMWALATRGQTAPWANPADSGLVHVSASSVMEDSTPLSAVVGRDTVRCVTKPLPNSWIVLDVLADKRLLLTHYTLRHYASWDTECLRSWRVEASLTGDVADASAWTVLREHTMDENLNGKGGTFTWSINGGDVAHVARTQQPFRFLRILQTAENSNKHHYLAISGLELYGRLLQADGVTPFDCTKAAGPAPIVVPTPLPAAPPAAAAAAASNVRHFRYQSDFDSNGVLYWLATNNYTRAWVNPAESGLIRVSGSSLNGDSEPLTAIVGNAVVRCVSQPLPDQWFAIDFGPTRLVQPTAYTLRHYSSWDTEALRNWRLEATTDSDPTSPACNWVRLTEHVDDASLDVKGATHTWPVSTTRFFRAFRVHQFDRNSNKHHYLALSGFEIYGAVKFDSQDAAWPAPISARAPPPLPIAAPSAAAPTAAAPPAVLDAWDPDAKGAHLAVASPALLRNSGSQDKWQMGRGRRAYARGINTISIKIAEDPNTSNTWRFIIGVIPASLDCRGAKQWVGTSNSWGYIGGTGGKCHNTAVSAAYGSKFVRGDVVTVFLDFDARIVGFFRNDEYQGTAFTDLAGPVHVAASLTATESALLFVPTPPAVMTQVAAMNAYGYSAPLLPAAAAVAPSPLLLSAWDPANKSSFLTIEPVTGLLRNANSNDKWQSCRSVKSFSLSSGGARQRFDVELVDCPKTNNSWQVIVGVVPATFTCVGNKQWVGAGESWGYIAGTGGKCFNQPKSIDYGERYGRSGDVISVQLDFAACTIEFFKNGVSQGTAFTNLIGPVYAAVSLTATGASARLQIAQ